MKYLRLWRLV